MFLCSIKAPVPPPRPATPPAAARKPCQIRRAFAAGPEPRAAPSSGASMARTHNLTGLSTAPRCGRRGAPTLVDAGDADHQGRLPISTQPRLIPDTRARQPLSPPTRRKRPGGRALIARFPNVRRAARLPIPEAQHTPQKPGGGPEHPHIVNQTTNRHRSNESPRTAYAATGTIRTCTSSPARAASTASASNEK
jgi:hypothetical protein